MWCTICKHNLGPIFFLVYLKWIMGFAPNLHHTHTNVWKIYSEPPKITIIIFISSSFLSL